MSKQNASVIVVGAGPAGLMAAQTLARAGLHVIICDRMASPARKFLLAGRGGLNLTHSEALAPFVKRYGPAAARLAPVLEAFTPDDLRRWSEELGEPTFVGSSGRVFPKSFKTSPLLRAWLRSLTALGVELRTQHRFTGWAADGALTFAAPSGDALLHADAVILALGGGSWAKLGSDGAWTDMLAARGVALAPLLPSNCGFDIAWSPQLRDKFAGAPLKNIALTFEQTRVRGEALITANGIEGSAIYALSPRLRDAIIANGEALLQIDLHPDRSEDNLAQSLARPRAGQSTATFLRKAAGLTPVAISLLREAGPLPTDSTELAGRIKRLPLRLTAPRPIERAISSAGGVRFDELDERLMIKRMPGVFLAGEMIDWKPRPAAISFRRVLPQGWLRRAARRTG